MSVCVDIDPVDIEEIDMHDGEGVSIDVYGKPDDSKEFENRILCLGYIVISSKNDTIRIITGDPQNITLEDENGCKYFNRGK